MRILRYSLLSFIAFCSCTKQESSLVHQPKQINQPNVLILFADDLGYGDLSCYGGNRIKTPNIDTLANSGIRFTSFYSSSAVCSPTRSSLISGKYPFRYNILSHFKDEREYLPVDTNNIAWTFKKAGYFTSHIGKWHLGGLHREDFRNRNNGIHKIPGLHEHGFDHYLCFNEEKPYRSDYMKERIMYRKGGDLLVRNDEIIDTIRKHWTDIKGDEAISVIKKSLDDHKPFFINLWWDVPHTPYEPAPDNIYSKYDAQGGIEPDSSHYGGSNRVGDEVLYNSMVAHMDANIGRIIKYLKDNGLYENTIIFFSSDNGPSYRGSAKPWKAGKADLHEGGIRVPGFLTWSGKILPKIENRPSNTIDILPTLASAASINYKDFDGINLLNDQYDRNLFWEMEIYKWYPQPGSKPKPYSSRVIRSGNWKLLADTSGPKELFNMEVDSLEQNNVLANYTQLADSLYNILNAKMNEERNVEGYQFME